MLGEVWEELGAGDTCACHMLGPWTQLSSHLSSSDVKLPVDEGEEEAVLRKQIFRGWEVEVDGWNGLVCSAGLVEKWKEPERQGRLRVLSWSKGDVGQFSVQGRERRERGLLMGDTMNEYWSFRLWKVKDRWSRFPNSERRRKASPGNKQL